MRLDVGLRAAGECARCLFNVVLPRSMVCWAGAVGVLLSRSVLAAGLSVGASGQPSYDIPISVPPGIAGMAPSLGLVYAEGTPAGSLGVGWSIQGLSVITRCSGNRATDGAIKAVNLAGTDKLCLNGQRLIQTDAAGTPLVQASQINDATGLAGTAVREFRTETDAFSRIRAYGTAGTLAANGPSYFKIWTKAGQVLEFGTNPGGNANAQVTPVGGTVVTAWAVSRITDVVGNFIDFKYDQRAVAWGSGPTAGAPTQGREWNIAEIQYAGNKVVFTYGDRPAQTPSDTSEAYHGGVKNVTMQRLTSITTYVNATNVATRGVTTGAVPVKTYWLSYTNGTTTGRSTLAKVQECAGGPTSTKCMPFPLFVYAYGRDETLAKNTAFASSPLATRKLSSADGKYGVLIADFNGDGKSDILRWSEIGTENELWFSNGEGTFTQVLSAAGGGKFNIAESLITSNGCMSSFVTDLDGDGLPDIVRLNCTTSTGDMFLNGGDGSFSKLAIKIVPSFTDLPFVRSVRTCTTVSIISLYTCTKANGFYFIDVNGDGLLDIVLAELPIQNQTYTGSFPTPPTTCTGCTKVYLQTSGGGHGFYLAPSNLDNAVLWTNPGSGKDLRFLGHVQDVNGDGLPDLVGIGALVEGGGYISNGDLTFTAITFPPGCFTALPIDFNGDAKADCLTPSSSAASNSLSVGTGPGQFASVSGFNLKSVGQELNSGGGLPIGSNYGVEVADFNGDGRQDLLRWHDDKTKNIMFISNGDGTFRQSSLAFNGFGLGVQLRSSSGAYDFRIGDFTGKGYPEILRLSNAASGTAPVADDLNMLIVSGSTANAEVDPDAMTSIFSATAMGTTITRERLTTTSGVRYFSDRGTANAAVAPRVDLIVPKSVVKTVSSETGAGGWATSEYAYRGLKVDTTGRGVLGFREFRVQSDTGNGLLTTVTRSMQDFPYTGQPALAYSYASSYGDSSALLSDTKPRLTQSSFSYCDTGSSSVPSVVVAGSIGTPCLAHSGAGPYIYRPYLYQKVEQAWDLQATAGSPEMTKTTSSFSYDATGNALSVSTTTSGTTLGVQQDYTQLVSNIYFPANTAGDNWILGRLQKTTVTNTVPVISPSTATGTSPHAAERVGTGTVTP